MSSAPSNTSSPEAGFTIVETLVALFVFAVAAMALVQMQTQSVDTFSEVETRALADIVAENQLVDIIARPVPPALGVEEGEAQLGGRAWRWRVDVMRTDDPSTLRLRASVFVPGRGGAVADVSAYKTASVS